MKVASGAACALLFCGTAMAAQPPATASQNFLDIFYAPDTKFKVDDTDPSSGGSSTFSGNGYGLRTMVHAGDTLAFEGEYEKSKLTFDIPGFGSFKLDQENARLGAGVADGSGSGVFLQWINLKTSDDFGDEDSLPGWGLHGRAAHDLSPQLHVYGDLGYQQFKDNDFKSKGLEYSGGAVFDVNPGLGVFLDYRASNLKSNNQPNYPVKFNSTDLRLGLRVTF